MTAKTDVSIIITCHSEGILLHKTILSVIKALKKIDKNNIGHEIIVHADTPTDIMLDYLKSHQFKSFKTRLLQNNFGDLSLSRNFSVSKANGKFIAFIDADDLMSDNWLYEAYKSAKSSKKPVVVHPEYSIVFGESNLVWKKRSSNGNDYDVLCMIGNNLWDSACLAPREIFIKYPYTPITTGFIYEDKHFNCQTLSSGIQHIIAPKTILFVRRKDSDQSLLASSDAISSTIAPTSLFSFDSIKSIRLQGLLEPVQDVSSSKKIRRSLLELHRKLNHSTMYRTATRPLVYAYKNNRIIKNDDTHPKWLINSWHSMHSIEKAIFPSDNTVSSAIQYSADNITPGISYTEIVKDMHSQPDTLFFIPHLIKGGADKVFINYANTLSKEKGWRIAMLQTNNKKSEWQNLLHKSIDFINVFDITKNIDPISEYNIIATMLVQLKIKRIIVGQSQFAYDFIYKYKKLLRRLGIAVYCFAFCDETDKDGRIWGYIHTGIPKNIDIIYKIITDNKHVVKQLEDSYALDKNKFRVHYQPTDIIINRRNHVDKIPIKILWASRICQQKAPEVLKQISNGVEKNFIIDAYGQLEEGYDKDYFTDSNVHYKGSFNGISSIPMDDYDIFLYTSHSDGIPNILQEVIASGLPIIAPNVGGIGEIINNNTGRLISKYDNINEYLRAIQSLSNALTRQKISDAAQDLLRRQFSYDKLVNNINQDFDK